MASESGPAAAAWDAEYAAGRYASDPPVAFTRDILAAARQAGLTRVLYIGCGNGRNYLPLATGGLDLTGLDISAAAITQLAAHAPDRADRLVLPPRLQVTRRNPPRPGQWSQCEAIWREVI